MWKWQTKRIRNAVIDIRIESMYKMKNKLVVKKTLMSAFIAE